MMSTIFKSVVEFFLSIALCLNPLLGCGMGVEVQPYNAANESEVRIVQFNLRGFGVGKKSVAYRSLGMTALLNEIHPDSMGFQEATYAWMLCLQNYLTDYAYVGVGRDDGGIMGEFSPIFYLKDKYTLLDSGTFWLSETPDKPGSKSWGSACTRICTWALLANKETGKIYAHLNTHLDHVSDSARTHQMELVLQKAKEYIGDYPVVLTGDMNDDSNSNMYVAATSILVDTRLASPETDNTATFHNYGLSVTNRIIDYVFVSSDVTPVKYDVIDEKPNGDYVSDHNGICVDLKF